MEGLPGEENTTDISSRGELVTTLKERELWWRGQRSERPPQSNEERMKVNVTVADVMSKPDVTHMLDLNRFCNYGLCWETAWVKRFSIYFEFKVEERLRKVEWKEGALLLSWIHLGIHEPCSITNCFAFSLLVLLHNWTYLTYVLFWPWWVKGGACPRINKDQTK